MFLFLILNTSYLPESNDSIFLRFFYFLWIDLFLRLSNFLSLRLVIREPDSIKLRSFYAERDTIGFNMIFDRHAGSSWLFLLLLRDSFNFDLEDFLTIKLEILNYSESYVKMGCILSLEIILGGSSWSLLITYFGDLIIIFINKHSFYI